jgi:hypothetical protein
MQMRIFPVSGALPRSSVAKCADSDDDEEFTLDDPFVMEILCRLFTNKPRSTRKRAKKLLRMSTKEETR